MRRHKPAPQVDEPHRLRLPPIPPAIAQARRTAPSEPPSDQAVEAEAWAQQDKSNPLPAAAADTGSRPLTPIETDAAPPPRSPLVAEAEPGTRTLASALFTPSTASRAVRRQQRKSARGITTAARRAELDAKRAQLTAEKAERDAAAYLPPGGEPGPDALRSYRRLRLPPHRATSEVLGGAYPFLAEAGLGSEGVFIGHDAWSGSAFCFDPWVLYARGVLTNPNIVLAGVIGRGKSALAKSLVTRSRAFQRRKAYVPCDPKGEWTPVAHALGGQAIQLAPGAPGRINPLDEGPSRPDLSEAEWLTTVTTRRLALLRAITEAVLGRDLHPTESTALAAALHAVVTSNDIPTLPMVVQAMFTPAGDVAGSTVTQLVEDGREVAHALARLVGGDLGGLFDGPSTTRFDPSLPMISLDLSGVQGSDQLIALVMTCASAWMEAALADPSDDHRWVIYDEAWRLLRSPSLLSRMQSQWKLSRALGIANLMIIHRISDLDAVGEANSEARNLALGLLADCSTKIIYAQEAGEADKTAGALGLSTTEARELPNLIRGEGLWRIRDRAFVVRHLCTPGELAVFDTNARMA